MSEWLDQYTVVSQKQQDYLSRIHELRRGLEQNGNKHVLAAVDKMRIEQREKYRWKFPPYSTTRTKGSALRQRLAPFPSRPCLFHDSDQGNDKPVPKLNMAPNFTPRKLAPIVKSVNTKFTVTKEDNNTHQVTHRPEMSTMRTEYECFESIAKRNKLNLTRFFNSSLSHRRSYKSYKRLPMSIPTVSIIDEEPEDCIEQKSYITDLSSKKFVSKK